MKSHSHNGFTLVELLLYTGIAALMVLTISSFLTLMLEARVKNRTIADVEQQGVQIMELMTSTIRSAQQITSPTTGTSSSTLTLDVVDAADDPTVFRLSGGQLVVDEGASPTTTAVTNDNVVVSALNFSNLSNSSTTGTIRIAFTVSYLNVSGKNEWDYSKTFTGNATVREN